MVLDACRDEPRLLSHFPKGFASGAPVRNLIEQQSNGTLIAYASGSGEPADARPVKGMSLYTSVLVDNLGETPRDLQEAILKTKENVYMASGGLQHPALYDNLQGISLCLRPIFRRNRRRLLEVQLQAVPLYRLLRTSAWASWSIS